MFVWHKKQNNFGYFYYCFQSRASITHIFSIHSVDCQWRLESIQQNRTVQLFKTKGQKFLPYPGTSSKSCPVPGNERKRVEKIDFFFWFFFLYNILSCFRTSFPVLECPFPDLEHPFSVLERLFTVFWVFLKVILSWDVPGLKSLSRDFWTPDQENFFNQYPFIESI